MLVDARARRAMFETPPEPVELGFGTGVNAVFDAGLLSDQSISTHYQTSEALHGAYTRLRDLGVEVPTPPRLLTDNSADAYLDLLDSHKGDISALRTTEVGPPDPFLKTGEEIRADVQGRVAEARALASRAGLGAQLVGGAAVGLTDPINIASLPLGVFAAETLLGRMAIEGAIGLASQGGVEYAAQGARERAGVAPTAGEVAGNVLAGGALGAGFGAVFHGAGLVARRLGLLEDYHAGVRSGRIVPDRKTEAAADALQDAVDTIPAGVSPKMEAAHLNAVGAAADVLAADHPLMREAAQRRLSQSVADWMFAATQNERELAGGLSEITAAAREAAAGAPMSARRIEGGVEISVGDRVVPIMDPDLARRKWTLPQIEKALAAQMDEVTMAQGAAEQAAADAQSFAGRLVDGGVGKEGGDFFRNPRQAEAARDALGLDGLEVVRLGKQRFALRPTGHAAEDAIESASPRGVERARLDAAIAAEQATPTPAVVERAITEPVEAPRMTTIEQEQREAFNTIAAENDDLDMTIDLDGEELRGHPSEIMARLDAEEAELTGTVDCMVGAEVVP